MRIQSAVVAMTCFVAAGMHLVATSITLAQTPRPAVQSDTPTTSAIAQKKGNESPTRSANLPRGWRLEAWHGWMDAPYASSRWSLFVRNPVLGEAFLIGRYPAALGLRMERTGGKLEWGLQLGYRKHFTQHYVVAILLEERQYRNLSALATLSVPYHKGKWHTLYGHAGVGLMLRQTRIRAGPEAGTTIHSAHPGWQIMPLLVRVNYRQFGGFAGAGFGASGIFHTGLTYYVEPGRTFSR